MGKCVIFCAGGFDGLLAPIETEDYIIAADGGYAHANALGITPNCLMGDFDSLGYTPREALVYPVKKDDTDAMLAVRRGLELGYREFVLYGALDGPRLDHTVANLQLLSFLASHNARGWLVGNTSVATLIQDSALRFRADAKGYFSLFAMGGEARLSVTGAEYPLSGGFLTPDFPLGVSNRFIGEGVEITAHAGRLLVIWERRNGFCEVPL